MVIDPFVEQFIDKLNDKYLNKWTNFLFHYSDILNIESILKSGKLLSRTQSENNNLLKKDCAGKEVLDHTLNYVKDHVRLYFRPKTPPLFHKEGFCPYDNKGNSYNAHCPVPVYLVFNAKKILSISNVLFSSGNLSSNDSIIYSNKTDLQHLEFDKIYHDTYLPQSHKSDIINKRCAEVIIPNHLDLNDSLEYIVCRSLAERETLVNILDSSLSKKYSKNIFYHPQYFSCAKQERQFVNKVNLQADTITIDYNKLLLKPFEYEYTFKTSNGEPKVVKNVPIEKWNLQNFKGNYTLSIKIDNHIAYLGHFTK